LISLLASRLNRGMRVGLPIGIAIGISSFRYSRSTVWGTAVGMTAAILAATSQALMDERSERRLQAKGINLKDPPVRPLLQIECTASPERVIQLCKEAMQSGSFRIAKLDAEDPLQLRVVTKTSFYSWRERITVTASEVGQSGCTLAISSVPWLPTTRADAGVNYTNVFLLSKYVKDHLGQSSIVRESLVDQDTQQPVKL
jgi:hypothetical protein